MRCGAAGEVLSDKWLLHEFEFVCSGRHVTWGSVAVDSVVALLAKVFLSRAS